MADGGTGNLPVIALDAMGGDRAPEEIVAGAVRAVAELDVEILLAGPAGRCWHRSCGRPRPGITVLPAQEVIAMGDEPAERGAHQEGRLARALRRGRPRRAGRGDGRGRQHRRDDGRRPAAYGPHQRRGPARDRGAVAGARE